MLILLTEITCFLERALPLIKRRLCIRPLHCSVHGFYCCCQHWHHEHKWPHKSGKVIVYNQHWNKDIKTTPIEPKQRGLFRHSCSLGMFVLIKSPVDRAFCSLFVWAYAVIFQLLPDTMTNSKREIDLCWLLLPRSRAVFIRFKNCKESPLGFVL